MAPASAVFPALTVLPAWEIRAKIRVPGQHGGRASGAVAELHLTESSGLQGQNRFVDHVPEECEKLVAALRKKRPDWIVDDEPPLMQQAGGKLVAADLAITVNKQIFYCEWFHRWHCRDIRPRLAAVEHGELKNWLIGVDRSVSKQKAYADLADDPALQKQGFLFASYPGVTHVVKAIESKLLAG